MKNKYVYLVGNEYHISAFSYNKDIAKLYLKQKNSKSLNMVKVKVTEKVKQNLHEHLEINKTVLVPDSDIFLTESDEEYIIESLSNFLDDVSRGLEKILINIDYLKFNDDELDDIKQFKSLLKHINKMLKKMDDGEYVENCYDEIDRFALINMETVVKFAKKYFL